MALAGRWTRFVRDRRAAVAVEFALILPFMLLLLFGGIDITQGVTARRKLDRAANTVSDLVARSKEVTAAQVENVFTAAAAVLTPFNATPLKTIITSVVIDANGVAWVGWSRAKNATAHQPGVRFSFPASFPQVARAPNSSVIVAELSYAFKPAVGYAIVGTLNMTQMSYAIPRVASSATGVACKWEGCPPTS